MKRSWRVGFSFGLTSGIITTLGLMVGLNSGTGSRLVVIGGIITIAIADSLSDSISIHISQEVENSHSHREVWESTVSTLLFKFIFSSIFIFPVLFFSLQTGITISVILGLYLICMISFKIARERKVKAWKVVGEHIFIAVVVIILTHFAGLLVSKFIV